MRTPSIGSTTLLAPAIALAAGCASPERQPGATAAPESTAAAAEAGIAGGNPEDTDWGLVDLDGQPALVADGASGPSLRLDPSDGRVSGETGCNRFFGPYELSGESLRFGALASTRRACLDPGMNRQESAFLQALSDTRSGEIVGDRLVLSGETGPVASFAPRTAR